MLVLNARINYFALGMMFNDRMFNPWVVGLSRHLESHQLSITYVSLRLRVQNAVSAQPCVGKFRISLVLFNFLHCNFRLWFETP